MYCECGCGERTEIAKQSRTSRGWTRGEYKKFARGHRASSPSRDGYKKAGRTKRHIVIASKALGKPLPAGVEVHHVDSNKQNNANSNLVICQDVLYHRLLHVRARLVRAGADPDTHKICGRCEKALHVEYFNMNNGKRYGFCKSCASEYKRSRT